jgi:nucleotide-binding universal stress UspA family protein
MYLPVDVVLAAVNFQEANWENTVRHAGHRALAHEARLHLVNVTEQPHWITRRVMDGAALEDYLTNLREGATERLQNAAKLVDAAVEVSTEVRSGKPSVEILAAAEEQGADLIVTGMHTPSATKMVMGGTSDRLLRVSPIPVWVAGPKPPKKIERILAPTGLGPSGRFALNTAVERVEAEGEVKALYLVALPSVMNAYSGDVLKLRRDIESVAREEFESHVAEVAVPEGKRPIVRKLMANLEVKPAADSILDEARESETDLICFALGGRGLGPGMLIGRVSEKVVRNAPCCVLALPDAWVAKHRG